MSPANSRSPPDAPSPTSSTSSLPLPSYSRTSLSYGPQDYSPTTSSPASPTPSTLSLPRSQGRSRARAFSILHEPFGSTAYEDALDEEVEMTGMGREEERRSYKKETFQSLGTEEVWWMVASAASVLGLTVAAVVVTALG